MITASVSLSPIVVAVSVAENQVQQRITTKILKDQIKEEALLATTLVTAMQQSNAEEHINPNTPRSIDFRA